MVDYEQAWIDHLGAYQPRYPREVCYHVSYGMVRHSASNPTEYISTIRNRVNHGDVWVGVQSLPQQDADVWDKAYIDIDVPEGIPVAYQDKVDLDAKTRERYGLSPRCAFTASKGFAVYLDFPPTELDPFQVKMYCLQLTKSIGIHSDPVVNGDRRRICRLPYTFNYKSLKTGRLRMCVPVDPEWSLGKVLEESIAPIGGVDWSPRPCPEIAREIASIPVPRVLEAPIERVAPDALEALLDIAEFINDGRHRTVFKVVMPLCVQAGLGREGAMDYARRFIERSGKSFHNYQKYSEQAYDWCAARPDIRHMKLERLLDQNPEIAEAFVHVTRENGY